MCKNIYIKRLACLSVYLFVCLDLEKEDDYNKERPKILVVKKFNLMFIKMYLIGKQFNSSFSLGVVTALK